MAGSGHRRGHPARLHSARLSPPGLYPPTRRSLLKGLLAFRWLTILWAAAMFTLVQVNRRGGPDAVDQPVVGYLLIGVAVVFTAGVSVLYRRRPDGLLHPPVVLGEVAVGTVLLLADTWVHGSPDHPQTLPSIWVVAGVAGVAMAGGRRPAVITGAGMGLARLVGMLPFTDDSGRALYIGASTMALLSLTGWVVGYMLHRLAEADRSISAYLAREEVARTLHDGVLQTLAVIQRRSTDRELVTLARSQEQELRDFLFGSPLNEEQPGADLASGLRAAARRAEQRYGLTVQVVLAPDLPRSRDGAAHRVAGAVGEALTNAAKHGAAAGATVYAEPTDDGGLFVSVKDDGAGFDPATMVEGQGLSRSIRGRLAEVGGRVEIDGRPGRGTEVRMYL